MKKMSTKSSFSKSFLLEGIGLALVSAGALCFEINLIRLFSVSQFYHFAFMVVSMALLGYGVSGTVLSLIQKEDQDEKESNLPLLAACSGLSMLIAFLIVNHIPFDSFSIIVDPSQLIILFLHYILLSSPFFFSGLMVSLLLRKYDSQSGTVYALNLVGSAVGCLLALVLPLLLDGEGVVASSAGICCIAGLIFLRNDKLVPNRFCGKQTSNLMFNGLTLFLALTPITSRLISGEVPQFFRLNISPYKSLSYAVQSPESRIVSSQWNSISRVDVVKSPSLHSIPGLSYRYLKPLPDIEGLFIDGDNMNAILPPGDPAQFSEYLPFAVTYQLHENPEVLILGPKGGMEIQAAKALGASKITAVEGNPLVISAAEHVYFQNEVNIISSSGRSYLRSNDQKFDILQLPLTDSYHPVSSGAYSLGEDYRYTLEAFEDMLGSLAPGGTLVITRWLQESPSEWLRAFTLAVSALEEIGVEPSTNIIAMRGYNTGTLLVKTTPFEMDEINLVRAFAQEKAFDIVSMPDLSIDEVNQFNILPEPIYYITFNAFLNSENHAEFYDTYPYDVTPPTDNHPFFGHYFKWSQIEEILQSLGETWQPFGGVGYLVILLIFFFALILSTGLIFLPVILKKQERKSTQDKHFPLYFGAIGLAFMLVEIPLIQGFILILDQPAYAMAAVLFGILLFSGIGSHFGVRILSLRTALEILIFILLSYFLLLPNLLNRSLGMSLTARLGITMLLIAPLGFLMGIPFSAGLERIRKKYDKDTTAVRWMVSYIWAVNGASSVISSILASLISLSFGFRITLAVGMVFYTLAFFFSRKFVKANPQINFR
jgi:hypothetical protein